MVVIIGAGVVGAATAYYLSSASGVGKIPITVLDAVGPAAGSSGRAGAFVTNRPPTFRRGIGEDNNTDDKRRALFEKSFELHVQLAKDLDLGSFCQVQNYRTIQPKQTSLHDGNGCSADTVQKTEPTMSDDDEGNPNNNKCTWLEHLGDDQGNEQLLADAALVDPAELTGAMLEKALSHKNCSFQQGCVAGLEVNGRCVTAIQLEGNEPRSIAVDEEEPVVIALGPWSCRIEDWLGIPMPIEGVLSTSLVYQDGIPTSDIGTAYFFDEESNGCHLEVFGRKDRSLYVSGCGESEVIGTRRLRSSERPSPNAACPPNEARAAAAQTSLQSAGYSPGAGSGQPDTLQACIRPVTPDGVPVVGKLMDNVYVATGGGPWGITWGPLMGQTLASLINDDGDPPIRLGPLSPKRFDTFVYKTLLKSRTSQDVATMP
mmetsp:Transcript_15632/g.43302  ORF Transcript_15632/g.43302 Transcript_15632/m.43302 type:complete len:430 (-) Transcript_15632:108-1397(-)